jgi:nicotinate phosphoribosyltransferase
MSIALLTDRYELTMLEGALSSGLADHRAVFEVFARRLPAGRRFGVVAGQGRLAELLPQVVHAARSCRISSSSRRARAAGSTDAGSPSR